MSPHARLPNRLTPLAILPNVGWLTISICYKYPSHSFLYEVFDMKNTVIKPAILLPFLALGGCSTYNAFAPKWAKIGEPETETKTTINN